MDLVAGIRKEGSRGGRADFKWSDVQNDQHRENYLGHSLMAPVGRWQKNRDLSWYAKGDNSEAAQSAADARAEEIRRIKEAEQDALSEALGYPVMPRPKIMEKVEAMDVEKAIKETGDDDEKDDARGVGFGGVTGLAAMETKTDKEVLTVQRGAWYPKSGGNEVEVETERETEGGEAAAEIVTDTADIGGMKMMIGGLTGDIDHDHATEIGMAGKGHGRGALRGGGTANELTSREGSAAIHLLHDVGIGLGRGREKEATIDDAEPNEREPC